MTRQAAAPSSLVPIVTIAIWLVGIVVLIAVTLAQTNGLMIYTIDDPYIHLAVAENILHGGYGINLEEYSAPCSSIIYPFLLAATEWIHKGGLGALVLNLLSMAGSVYLVARMVTLYVSGSNLFKVLLSVALAMTMNAWALPMTGMEHSLHVFASLCALWFLIRAVDGQPGGDVPMVLAIVALPLIRFEGAAQALLSIAVLAYVGRWRASISAAILITAAAFGWYTFTQRLGLPVMPSSVQVKSGIVSNLTLHKGVLSSIAPITRNFFDAMKGRQGSMLMLLLVLLGVLSWAAYKPGQRRSILIGGTVVCAGVAHILFGQFGWFSRYEIYAFAMTTACCVVMGGHLLTTRQAKLWALLSLFFISMLYSWTAIKSPWASRNVYQQNYQMHRFATEYWKRPVAVNDLGWVAYDNPLYVLDIYGLGSEEVRKARFANGNALFAADLERLVARRNIQLVMIYEDWFIGLIPKSWVRVATLETPVVSSGNGKITFFSASGGDQAELKSLIEQFAPSLPPDVKLTIVP